MAGQAVMMGGCCCLIISLVIGVCCYFAGYKQRVSWNSSLKETICTITDHYVIQSSCSYSCCHTIYVGGSPRQSCSTCYRQCYEMSFVVNWTITTKSLFNVNNTMSTTYSKLFEYGKRNDWATAMNVLQTDKPRGKKIQCFYYSGEPYRAELELFHDTSFLVAAWIFFAFAIIGAIIAFTGGVMSQSQTCETPF